MGTTTGGIPFPDPTTRVADSAQVTKDMAVAIDRALDLQQQILNIWQPEDGVVRGEVLSWDGSDWVATPVPRHGEHVPVTGPGDTSKVLTVDAAGDSVWADLPDLTDLASKSYADNAATTAAAGVVNSAPETLNTLNELSTALGNDPNFATTIATQIGEKAAASALTAHEIETTDVHGIADTALLETTAGAQAKADAAVADVEVRCNTYTNNYVNYVRIWPQIISDAWARAEGQNNGFEATLQVAPEMAGSMIVVRDMVDRFLYLEIRKEEVGVVQYADGMWFQVMVGPGAKGGFMARVGDGTGGVVLAPTGKKAQSPWQTTGLMYTLTRIGENEWIMSGNEFTAA